MSDLPLTLLQLINKTASNLGIGEADRRALEIALQEAFILGIKRADEIIEDEIARNKSNARGA